jgi:hypothetical protein
MESVLNGSTRRLSCIRAVCLGGLVWALSACGPLPEEAEVEPLSARAGALGSQGGLSLNGLSLNGLSLNGLSLNGLSLNGLSLNGLSLNGLSLSGLASPSFSSWFESEPTLHQEVMRYVVRCAVPAGELRAYASAQTGQRWTWAGGLGLAPGWSAGQRASLTEQQLVSACLAAHANKFGVNISLSIQGRTATNAPIATSALELQAYPEREGCFFGNAFNGEGLFVGNDAKALNHKKSTARACALGIKKSEAPECAPLVRVEQDCADLCTRDASGTAYATCTYNGVTYPALTTRLRTEDIYTCGDGVCQVSEQCGTGNSYDSCQADCGRCP